MNTFIHSSLNKFLVSLLFLLSAATAVGQIRSGNSYINISKRAVGGTVQSGDTLEIRTNYYIPTGFNSNNLYSVRYLDNIPTNTVYIGDSLRLITNEGLTHKRWTNNGGDDAATYIASPPAGNFNIRINIGAGVGVPTNTSLTDLTGGGNVKPDVHRPRVGAGMLITTSFRVRVTGSIGGIITLGAGRLRYRDRTTSTANHIEILATQYQILIANNDPICNNAIGKNFVAEAGGTFDSSTTQNRPYGPNFLIPSYTFRTLTPAQEINDGYYTIVNNLSRTASTFQNAQKRPTCPTGSGPTACANRMFSGHWDIIGDHTGSTTPAGNPPAAVGSPGGYMLVVNADYATSEAYRQSISGLCPNTSYEFSLWVRNVCTNCGIDSTGTSTFRPGVLPNLTFAIDDLDRYSSGQVDTVGWVKKGFLFKTGPSQTAVTISIRNNASGGGGNDWAIDDIALVTCNPALSIIPTGNSTVCYGNQVNVSTTVRAFFNNYTSFRWEKSIDGGNSWNMTQTGTGSPSIVSGAYQYVSALPTFLADSASHLNQYRFIVASSAANLTDPNCAFAASTIITVLVNNCQGVLKSQLLSFDGKLSNNRAELSWLSVNEKDRVKYVLEKSVDNSGFFPVATIFGHAIPGASYKYSYTDPDEPQGKVSYRIMTIEDEEISLSGIVHFNHTLKTSFQVLQNPFQDIIKLSIRKSNASVATVRVIDVYGRVFTEKKIALNSGTTRVELNETASLPKGQYIVSINSDGDQITHKVIKQ